MRIHHEHVRVFTCIFYKHAHDSFLYMYMYMQPQCMGIHVHVLYMYVSLASDCLVSCITMNI